MWYPQSVTLGEPITTDKVIERLAQISTVSKSDVQAVLGDLASVLADYMALGYTVKLDGLGTFYYTAVTEKQGVATAAEVNANQITGVRIRFIPESTRTNGNRIVTRALSDTVIKWRDIEEITSSTGSSSSSGSEGGTESGGSESGGESGGNPLG
ncbi:MAG: HU family DNA-binding protein [Bacteroides sp.]|nr:HU family DNA-binding protein [Bacteroides sp.]